VEIMAEVIFLQDLNSIKTFLVLVEGTIEIIKEEGIPKPKRLEIELDRQRKIVEYKEIPI
jgi:hypothetical protein